MHGFGRLDLRTRTPTCPGTLVRSWFTTSVPESGLVLAGASVT